MKNKLIITHAGSFHADELMAIALLERFYFINPLKMSVDDDESLVEKWIKDEDGPPSGSIFFDDGVEDTRTPVMIIRTRNNSLLNQAKSNPDVFVLDVGGEYDGDALNFDHHQKSMNETWPDGTPYSSTGLAWVWLKKNNHLNMENEVIQDLEYKVIKPLDAHDNGIKKFDLASIISGFNRSTDNPEEQNRQFFKARKVMLEFLDNSIFEATLKLDAKKVLKEQWDKAQRAKNSCVLLHKSHPYHDLTTLLKNISNNKADMIIIPGQGNRFSVISQPIDTPFSIKMPCPKEWRGKMNFNVKMGSKKVMINFAHKSGFMCVVEGSHSDALLVANHIVKYNQNLNHDNKKITSSHIDKNIKEKSNKILRINKRKTI